MHLCAKLIAASMTLEPLREVGANFSLQLSSRTQFTKINNKKVIAENECEKHKKSSLVRSKLGYDCIIYGSARKSYLQMLDPIHNQGHRLALEAFRTSPVASLYVEADEPSLYSRRDKLSLQYAIKLAANPSNPAHEVTFPPNYVDLYEQKPKVIKSFCIRISPLLESANIKPQNIEKHFTPNIPAWCMKPPELLFDLHSGKKSESNPHILKDDFRKMQSRYKNYQQIYTDGSKEDSKVGCAVISDYHSNMQRIPDD